MISDHAGRTQIPSYFSSDDFDLSAFDRLCSQVTNASDYPLSDGVVKNIPVYSGDAIRAALADSSSEAALKAELCRCLKDGPGVFAISGAYDDLTVIDRGTALFEAIIQEEKESGLGQGDHFGNNERIWNSLQKFCVADPELFIEYYGNPVVAIAAEAWLGPFYKISAQVNNVKPGSKEQTSHRDYHLGFQTPETVARFPAHAQVMSQYLTLQGAIAHVDMPLETGPTRLLPYSQLFPPGYMCYTNSEFASYFDEHSVPNALEERRRGIF